MYNSAKNTPKKSNKTLPIHMLYNTIFTQITTDNLFVSSFNEQSNK
jgi:hypothetical protein